jgi:acetyl esterase/lipase
LPRQTLDVYVPAASSVKAPVLIFFYGGSWQTGSKDMYRFVGQAFASAGIVTVIADYRVYPEVSFPEYVGDAAAATAWVERQVGAYGGDPHRLFIAGHSAGAQIAALLVLDPLYLAQAGVDRDNISGLIGLAGPYDFLPLTDPTLRDIFATGDIRRSQPIHFVDGTFPGVAVPPAFLATGDDDHEVLPKNTARLGSALRARGGVVVQHDYPGVGHIGIILSLAHGFRGKAPARDQIVAFVTAHAP